MNNQAKVTRRLNRKGQAILRKRGGFHSGTKHVRPQQANWGG